MRQGQRERGINWGWGNEVQWGWEEGIGKKNSGREHKRQEWSVLERNIMI